MFTITPVSADQSDCLVKFVEAFTKLPIYAEDEAQAKLMDKASRLAVAVTRSLAKDTQVTLSASGDVNSNGRGFLKVNLAF